MLDRTKLAVLLLVTAILSGCNSEGDAPAETGTLRPPGSVAQPPEDPPAQDPPAGGSGGSPSGIGPSCVDASDPDRQCIGVKIVSYTNSAGTPTLTEDEAAAVMAGVNSLWSPCNVAFQIDEYEQIDPTTVGLSYGSASQGQTTQIRSRFSDDRTFLFVSTGSWNTSTIAWTQLPGGGPYGAVIEADYSKHKVTVAHELGHYMGLDHSGTSGNVMGSVVYSTNTNVSSSQCSAVRSTNERYWQNMLR